MEVGGGTALSDSAWWLLQLAIKKPGQRWMAHSSAFLYKRAWKMVLSPCRDSISGFFSLEERSLVGGP